MIHKYKVDAVITVMIQTREQIEKLKQIYPTLQEICLGVSPEEKKMILNELSLLRSAVDSLG